MHFGCRSHQGQHIPLKTSLHEEISLIYLKCQIKKICLTCPQTTVCPHTYVCTCECIYESIYTHIYTHWDKMQIIWVAALTIVSTCLFWTATLCFGGLFFSVGLLPLTSKESDSGHWKKEQILKPIRFKKPGFESHDMKLRVYSPLCRNNL